MTEATERPQGRYNMTSMERRKAALDAAVNFYGYADGEELEDELDSLMRVAKRFETYILKGE